MPGNCVQRLLPGRAQGHTFCGGGEWHGLAKPSDVAPVAAGVQQQHGACRTHARLDLQAHGPTACLRSAHCFCARARQQLYAHGGTAHCRRRFGRRVHERVLLVLLQLRPLPSPRLAGLRRGKIRPAAGMPSSGLCWAPLLLASSPAPHRSRLTRSAWQPEHLPCPPTAQQTGARRPAPHASSTGRGSWRGMLRCRAATAI